MGMLVNGKWKKEEIIITNEKGKFIRSNSIFRNTINGSDNKYPAEKNRYHLYISYACPWACRALIILKLKRLDDIISYSSVEFLLSDKGWTFDENKKNKFSDPILNKKYLKDLYKISDPGCTSKVTVPVLWDKKTNTIVNNESSEIMRILNSEFNELNKKNKKYNNDFYPVKLRSKINKINDFIYENINNGVYKCGFASSQEAYDESCDKLFLALDKIDGILSKNEYLLGECITEADWRLFTTLIRFDCVYATHFKCNKKLLRDYVNLSRHLKQLYKTPRISETVDIDYIKKHYFMSHTQINPTGIVPQGF